MEVILFCGDIHYYNQPYDNDTISCMIIRLLSSVKLLVKHIIFSLGVTECDWPVNSVKLFSMRQQWYVLLVHEKGDIGWSLGNRPLQNCSVSKEHSCLSVRCIIFIIAFVGPKTIISQRYSGMQKGIIFTSSYLVGCNLSKLSSSAIALTCCDHYGRAPRSPLRIVNIQPFCNSIVISWKWKLRQIHSRKKENRRIAYSRLLSAFKFIHLSSYKCKLSLLGYPRYMVVSHPKTQSVWPKCSDIRIFCDCGV